MNKFIIALGVVIVSTISNFAQNSDAFHKSEFYVGYVNSQIEDRIRFNASEGRAGYNGLEVSGVGNISRYFGIKGDFSAAYRNRQDINRQGINLSVYNFLGGVQLKNNKKEGSRFRPFGHILAGAATSKLSFEPSSSVICAQPATVCPGFNIRRTGFAAAVGGGLDIKLSQRVSLRAVQIDYNPNHADSYTQDNFRFGFGVVFR